MAEAAKEQRTIRYDASRAAAWRKWFHIMEAGAQVLSDRMIQLAGISDGSMVLDIATGLGEPALTAARAAGPSVRVLATDLSPDMLSLAEARAVELGLINVDFQVMDANAIELSEASFDVAMSRWGLMFVANLDEALARIRRSLKPVGVFVAAVWGAPEEAPAVSLGNRVVHDFLGLPPPDEGPLTPFALRDTEALMQRARDAGFRDVGGEWVNVVYVFDSPEMFKTFRKDRAGDLTKRIAHMPPDAVEAAWQAVAKAAEEFVTADGTVRMENRAFCLVARR